MYRVKRGLHKEEKSNKCFVRVMGPALVMVLLVGMLMLLLFKTISMT